MLAVVVSLVNVLTLLGCGLRAFEPKATHKMVAAKVLDGRLMSADKPAMSTPGANCFVIR